MSGGIKVTVIVPSRLQIKPGQYINLWIPSISFWSFLQSHPFVVASCTGGQQTTLELLIGPQKGLTSKFLRNSTNGSDSVSDLRLALFSGPHGLSAPLAEFETVLLVASGLGIAAQLPYLRYLIRGYNDFQVRTRRIHLVWQLESLRKQSSIYPHDRQLTQTEDGALAQDLLNQALKEDTLDDGYVRLPCPRFMIILLTLSRSCPSPSTMPLEKLIVVCSMKGSIGGSPSITV